MRLTRRRALSPAGVPLSGSVLLGLSVLAGAVSAVYIHRRYGDYTAVPERLARYHSLNPELTMTYRDSVARVKAGAPRPQPGDELPIAGSTPLSTPVLRHMKRLDARSRTWAEQVQRIVAQTNPKWLVTSMIRPHRAHFSMHELGRAIDVMLPGPLVNENAASVSKLMEHLRAARLINMVYFGQTRNGNTVMHMEVHDLTTAGTPTSTLFINNGRHDEWLR